MQDTSTKYHKLTEAPGDKASSEQLQRLYHRYHFACSWINGNRVLEVACGTGIGLKYLAKSAGCTYGCDVDQTNLDRARQICHGEAEIRLDEARAEVLPYADGSFDVVILFEALYYLDDPGLFVREACRLLSDDGILLIGTVNCEWDSFHPSPLSKKYYSARELGELLEGPFAWHKMWGAFPTEATGTREAVISLLKKGANTLNLIPGSLRSRAWLKRIFFGELVPLPQDFSSAEIPYDPPAPLSGQSPETSYKIIYVAAGKGAAFDLPQAPFTPIGASKAPAHGGGRLKRLMDIAGSLAGLIALSPLLAIVSLSIYLHDRGPVLYRPLRMGRHKRPFRINKFRTMVQNADQIGGPTTSLRDNRITPVGHIMRRYKIDEVPQLVNVLLGEMSLVGPRPEVLSEVEEYGPEWDDIFLVRPGMTDWASIDFRHEDEIVQAAGMDDPHQAYKLLIQPRKLELQLDYARNHSLGVDLAIILATLKTVAGG
ncbi:MAG: sugar transferase [Desulfarculaceae bacterium]|nr:sugar transferase [Desulfarculaceae bacterium]